MGFIDNSGDIIFDVVLTDEGRRRLAKADGSFEIRYFALGDEEINYQNFVNNTGSAYQDLAILQTPILEAFTNNTSTMKTKLMTITDNNLLYLPILALNEKQSSPASTAMHPKGAYIVAVNANTENNNDDFAWTIGTAIGVDSTTKTPETGVIWGESITTTSTIIRVDAGLNTNSISPSTAIDAHSAEEQYLIEIDNRLGEIVSWDGQVLPSPDTIDDDNIALYSFSSAGENPVRPNFVFNNRSTNPDGATQVIAGPRSTYIQFKIKSSDNLRQSNYYFETLGAITSMDKVGGGTNAAVKYIDTNVRVTGLTTGYSIDIPVRFVKI